MMFSPLRWLGRNLGTLLLAFALALAVWVSSVINADPNQECSAPRQVALEIVGEDPALILMEGPPSQIEIRILAPRSVCQRLQEEGLVRAQVDLSGLDAGAHTVPAEPIVSASPVRIIDYSPREVQVRMERLVSRTFPINLNVTGEPVLGFRAEAPTLEVSEVTITGPESTVERVAEVQATYDISSARNTFQRSVVLQAVDASGRVVTDVELIPERVSVTQPIIQLGQYRNVSVKVEIEGQWARGYRLTNISVSPPTVTVFSENPRLVNELPGFIETEPLNLEGISDDIESRLKLVVPEGVTLVGDDTVLVQVSIAAIESTLTISLPIETISIPPEFQVVIVPDTVDIVLFGPLPVLDNLSTENIRVVVDLEELGEGVHEVVPLVDILPDRVEVQSIEPATVQVTLSRIPTPTPTLSPTETPTPTSVP